MVWMTERQQSELKAAEAHEKALKAEIAEVSGGNLDELRSTKERYEAEAAELREGYNGLRLKAQDNPLHRDAFHELTSRLSDVAAIIGALDRQMAQRREERADSLKGAWLAASETTALYMRDILSEAQRLDPLAALLNGYDNTVASGAKAAGLSPLPAVRVIELAAFLGYARDVQRAGIRIDVSKLPDAIRVRLEASR
jgi:hypothetical protein